MGDRAPTEGASTDTHATAARAFVDRVQSRFDGELERIYVFGSTARGETRGLASDVDVLVVISEPADRQRVNDTLGEIAYDVMLEYGPVIELHVLTDAEFERSRDQRHPFVRNVIDEGRSYAC